MATQIKELHAGAPTAGVNEVAADTVNPGDSFGIIGAGPVALAMKYFYEIQALYVQLMKLCKEIGIAELQVAQTTAISTADAAQASAHAAAGSTFMQAGGMIGSGVATSVGTRMSYRDSYNAANNKLQAASNEQAPLKSLDENMMKRTSNFTAGEDEETTLSPAAQNRKTQLLKGNFKMTEATPEEQLTIDKEVLANMKEDEIAQIRQQLPAKLQEAATNVNTAELEVKQVNDNRNNRGQSLSSLANAAGQTGSGAFQIWKGKEDAVEAIAKTTQQMAAGAVSTAGKQQDDNSGKASKEMDQLQAFRNGVKVN